MVWTPPKNISQLGWLFPIYGKIKNVPNHQPVWTPPPRLRFRWTQVQLEVCPLAPVSKALKAAVAEPCVLAAGAPQGGSTRGSRTVGQKWWLKPWHFSVKMGIYKGDFWAFRHWMEPQLVISSVICTCKNADLPWKLMVLAVFQLETDHLRWHVYELFRGNSSIHGGGSSPCQMACKKWRILSWWT